MIKVNEMQFKIRGNNISSEVVLQWEYQRLIKNYQKLKKIKTVTVNPDFNQWSKNREIQKMSEEIVRIKVAYGLDNLRQHFNWQANIGNIGSVIAAKLSRGKRKHSVTEIYVPKSELSPEEVMDSIIKIMMINSAEHLKINLGSNPDHYVLQSMSETAQEVLEITGGSPLPTHFFAHYGDEEGLTSAFSADYDVEAPGAARLANGTLIGGVRHQVKKEGDGFIFKAVVEFPSILPDSMIRAHEYHLACEFGHWLSAVI